MAITSLVAVAFLIPLALLVQQVAHERALAQAERQTAIVMSVLAVTTDPNAVEQVVASVEDRDTGLLAVHGLADTVVGTGHASEADIRLAAGQGETVVANVPGGLAYLEPIEVGDGRVAVVEVHIPDAALTAGVRSAQLALTAVAIGLVLGSAVVGDQLAARLVRPARSLASAASALGDGNLDVRVQPSGPRELAEAGYAFNQMANRLATLRTAEREMVADLSHRLRTPLTGLRLDVEALEAEDYLRSAAGAAGAGDDGDRHRTVARVRQALATLEHEIDVLIRTTRQANQRATGTPDEPESEGRCDAGDVVTERMHFWSAVAADQDRPCEVFGLGTPAPVRVPASELAAALDAVLGNAFRYTPQGTALEVAVSRHDGWVAVRGRHGRPRHRRPGPGPAPGYQRARIHRARPGHRPPGRPGRGWLGQRRPGTARRRQHRHDPGRCGRTSPAAAEPARPDRPAHPGTRPGPRVPQLPRAPPASRPRLATSTAAHRGCLSGSANLPYVDVKRSRFPVARG